MLFRSRPNRATRPIHTQNTCIQQTKSCHDFPNHSTIFLESATPIFVQGEQIAPQFLQEHKHQIFESKLKVSHIEQD